MDLGEAGRNGCLEISLEIVQLTGITGDKAIHICAIYISFLSILFVSVITWSFAVYVGFDYSITNAMYALEKQSSESRPEHLKTIDNCSDYRKNEENISSNTSENPLDVESPIVYHYLTYETELPITNDSHTFQAGPPPPEPDLTPYVSPFKWSTARKNVALYLSCSATVFTAYTAGSYAPPAAAMAAEWNVSTEAISVGITVFCAGFGIAPMVLAPFSEINGRYPVFIGAGLLFEVCQICCAITKSYPGMIVARFWVGAGGSVFSTMVGGVISDLYHTEERNTPMTLFSGAALFGTGLGPLVSGFITQNIHWRWVFWIQVIVDGLLISAMILFFKETRGSILLSRKAECLNRWYQERETAGYIGLEMQGIDGKMKSMQRIRWKVKSDEERESLRKMISISVYRPFRQFSKLLSYDSCLLLTSVDLLVTEPVVFFFSLWVSFAWAVLYLTFGAIPLVFSVSHNFNIEESGAVFASMSIGALLSTIVSIYQERLLSILLARTTSTSRLVRTLRTPSPEGRLYFACVESIFLPIGLFWFGWTQFSYIPWIVPTLAVGCATMGIFSVYLATFNYLADTYHRYASSALAAQSFCRNILGGIFPLIDTAMFTHLGFANASSLLGAIGVLLTFVPWVLAFYGPQIRARSKFASEIM